MEIREHKNKQVVTRVIPDIAFTKAIIKEKRLNKAMQCLLNLMVDERLMAASN